MRNIVIVAIGLAGVAIACSADPYGDKPDFTSDKNATEGECKEDEGDSSKAIEGKDPTTMTACKGTKGSSGRCVKRSELGNFKDTFESASCKDDEGCVPDDVVKSGSKVELKTCTGVLGKEGRCFWPLAKDIIDNYQLLKDASKECSGDMVCAPCVNPLTNKDTGVCSTGGGGGGGGKSCTKSGGKTDSAAKAPTGGTCPQKDPILDTKGFKPEDCGGGMVCVAENLVGDQAKMLKKCSTGVCAPEKAVARAGNYVPLTCKSTGGAEGRCMNVNIPEIAKQKDALPKGEGCDANEACAPCFDPRDGKPTGACNIASCDQPKEKAKLFDSCCGGRARCVPASAAKESADKLNADSCTGDTPLCAPVELIPMPNVQPRQCKSLMFVSGICVSKCALNVTGASLVKGDCEGDDICAPCRMLPAGTLGCAAQ